MNPTTDFSRRTQFRRLPSDFWKRIVNDEQLRHCNDLEKLLAGCEIIAALDELEVLLAA